MKLLGIDEHDDLFHRYRYDNDTTICIFSDSVVYYDHYLRVVLKRDSGKYSMENIDEGRVEQLPDLSKCNEAELFQFSTVMAIEPLKTIQIEINRINEDYE